MYLDSNKGITLSVDDSQFAIGATLMQDSHPIAYASASLTASQINYAQIEKELLAIAFGCAHFHQYIYGFRVTVETDHKTLIPIFKKPLYKIPLRLQRLMLNLQMYELDVTYKPWKFLYIADILSRAPLTNYYHIDRYTYKHSLFTIKDVRVGYTRNKE